MAIKNSEIFKICRAFSPTFANEVAEISAETLDAGMEALNSLSDQQVNSWYGTTLAFMLQKIDVADAKNPFEGSGIVETYAQPEAMFAQRIAVLPQKGNDPMFMNVADGYSIDQQVVRKGTFAERFFKLNMNYQNWTTLDDYRKKTIFSSPYGMDMLTAGIMSQLQSDYKKFRYVTALNVLNAGMNSEAHPLKDTQKVEITGWTGTYASDQLVAFIQALNNIESEMTLTPSTSAFNAAGFETAVDRERYTILMRAEVLNAIKATLTTGYLYGIDKSFLDLPFDVQPVLNFGGLEPYKEASYTTPLYPVYDDFGRQVKFNTAEDGTGTDVANDAVFWKDTNADVIAVIAQKGIIVETVQNPVRVTPAPYNAAGMYQNFFLNAPNNGMNYDYYYNLVQIRKPAGVSPTPSSIVNIGG